MAKETFTRTKPHVNVGTIGHIDHGKTTLTAAILAVLAERGKAKTKSYQDIAKGGTVRDSTKTVTIAVSHVEYESEKRHYAHIDCPGHADYIKNMITGAAQMDGGDPGGLGRRTAPDAADPRTRSCARQVGVPAAGRLPQQDRPGRRRGAAGAGRDGAAPQLLTHYKFPGDEIPIVRGGSSRPAAFSRIPRTRRPRSRFLDLVKAMDEYIAPSAGAAEVDKPVLDADRRRLLRSRAAARMGTGRIERGKCKVGDAVEIVGFGVKKSSTITGVEAFQKTMDEGLAGDNVGVLLRGVEKTELERGQVVCKPNSITPHTKFEAEVYVLSKDEGGRHTPFFKGYCPQFYFRTTDVTGSILNLLSENNTEAEMCMPGDNIKMTVELKTPIAMEESLRFAIREGGKTVGAGVVAKILE